jgi:hypothetical protein
MNAKIQPNKLQFLSISGCLLFLMLIMQGASGGRAANGDMDRTGAPGSGGTCMVYCHSGSAAFTNPQISVEMKDGSGTIATSYIPGATYTLEFTISSNGSPFGYGMQAVILDTSHNNVGDLLAVSTPNTQLTTIPNGREFIEQQGTSSTGFFSTTWQAPAIGTGDITLYGIGLAVDGSNDVSGDQASPSIQFSMTESTVNSLNTLEEVLVNYEIYPLPNNGTFFIENKGLEGNINIRIFNIAGMVVYANSINLNSNQKQELNVDNILNGIYLIELERDGIKETQKLMINK